MREVFEFDIVSSEVKKISEKETKKFFYSEKMFFSIKQDDSIQISKRDSLVIVGKAALKNQKEIIPSLIYKCRDKKIVYGGVFDLITFLVSIFVIVILMYIHPRAMIDLSLDGSLLVLFCFILFIPIVVRDFIKDRYMLYKYLKNRVI